jgi:hypothetical protein
MPTATRVAGFWTWKKLGRFVSAGAKGIRILAPIIGVRRKKYKEAQKDVTKQNERVLIGFRNAYVFDISQTNGVDLPAMHEVGGVPGDNIDRIVAYLKDRGIQFVYSDGLQGALGKSYGGRIAILNGCQRRSSSRRWCTKQRTNCCTRQNVARQPPRPCASWKPSLSRLSSGKPLALSPVPPRRTTSSFIRATPLCWPRAWKSSSKHQASFLPPWSRPQRRKAPQANLRACGGGGMKTLLAILQKAGVWRPSLYVNIENPPYMPLVIEAVDESGPRGLPALSVCHYGEQNGDAMRDPEMCFELGNA